MVWSGFRGQLVQWTGRWLEHYSATKKETAQQKRKLVDSNRNLEQHSQQRQKEEKKYTPNNDSTLRQTEADQALINQALPVEGYRRL